MEWQAGLRRLRGLHGPHARRKFFDLHTTNKSQLAEQALQAIGGLYEIERQARDLSDEDRWRILQEKAAPSRGRGSASAVTL